MLSLLGHISGGCLPARCATTSGHPPPPVCHSQPPHLPPPPMGSSVPWGPSSDMLNKAKSVSFRSWSCCHLPTYLRLRHIVAETHSPPRERAGMCCSGAVMDNIRCCLQKLRKSTNRLHNEGSISDTNAGFHSRASKLLTGQIPGHSDLTPAACDHQV